MHRIGRRQDGKDRLILEFVSNKTKEKVMKKRSEGDKDF